MPNYTLLAISGSLRKSSYNTALLAAFKERAPDGMTIEIAEIRDLPLFDQDLEADFPKVATDLKNKILAADGILISTPEYNRTMPGTLKNAIDWVSRPYGKNAWNEKPIFVMSASIGPIAGALGQFNLRQSLVYVNAYVQSQPEFYCGSAGSKFDEAGKLTDEDTKKMIDKGLSAFTAYIEKFRSSPATLEK